MRTLFVLSTLCLALGISGCSGGPLNVGNGIEPLAACSNGLRDYTETDADCGGAVCGGCAAHLHCTVAADCKSALCVGGSCCGADTGDCDGNAANGCEIDLSSDAHNCGACGTVCPSMGTCKSGQCQPPPTCACNPAHGTGTCASGTCALVSCDAGFADCDNDPANGCEVDSTSDDANCGACGNACVGGHCVAGACGAQPCGGPPHLAVGQACDCAAQCQSNFCSDGVCCNTACAGACVACDQPGSVGTCSAVTGAPVAGHGSCGAGQSCAMGTCTGAPMCTCNPAHGTGSCASGSCALVSCDAGYADCDGNVLNGCEVNATADDINCGACGNVCVGGMHCVAGACTAQTCAGQPHLALGLACACAADCQSGFCVDGVCCNTACAGTCVACNQPGTVGTCSAVTGAPAAGHGACGAGQTCTMGSCH